MVSEQVGALDRPRLKYLLSQIHTLEVPTSQLLTNSFQPYMMAS